MSDNRNLHRFKTEILDFTGFRREREQNVVSLRKQKREEQIAKMRNVFYRLTLLDAEMETSDVEMETLSRDRHPPIDEVAEMEISDVEMETVSDAEMEISSSAHTTIASAQISEQPNTTAKANPVSDDIIDVKVKQMLYSDDYRCQFEAAKKVRIALSRDRHPPIDEVMDIVPQFVNFLKRNDQTSLQFEAAGILTNMLSGTSEQTETVLETGVVPIFIELLSGPHDFLREQAVRALGNIATDSIKSRDHLLSTGVLAPLLRIISTTERISMLSNAVRTFASLCHGRDPPVDFSQFKRSLPMLAQLLHHTDANVLSNTCWAISHLAYGPSNQIQAIINTGACRRLVQLLLHPQHKVSTAALRAVGNLLTGTEHQTQVILNCKILPNITYLLGSNTATAKEDCCWIVSNIAAGDDVQIQALIDAEIFPVLFNVMQTADFRTQKEAAWATSNATTNATPEQIHYLVQAGCVPPLCELLTVADSDIVLVALRALANILKTGQRLSPFLQILEECGGLEKIETLQAHESSEIYHKSFEIIDQYFGAEADESKEYEFSLQLGDSSSESGVDF